MGIALWLACGIAAFFIARFIPLGRREGAWRELLTALSLAFVLGVVATALDFGGWRELDWRAGLFTFFAALAGIAAFRTVTYRH